MTGRIGIDSLGQVHGMSIQSAGKLRKVAFSQKSGVNRERVHMTQEMTRGTGTHDVMQRVSKENNFTIPRMKRN